MDEIGVFHLSFWKRKIKRPLYRVTAGGFWQYVKAKEDLKPIFGVSASSPELLQTHSHLLWWSLDRAVVAVLPNQAS